MGKLDLVGPGLMGAIAMGLVALTVPLFCSPAVDSARRIPREDGKSSIIKLYKTGVDGILVENPARTNEYLTFNKYLDSINNKYDRAIEKAKIEKLAYGEK